MQKWKYLILAVLILGVIYQVGASLWPLRQPVQQTWKTLGKSAVWRGVNFSSGQDFADYLEFLNRIVPLDARLVLPPSGVGPPAMSRTPYMQFFLAPRQVFNCTSDATECAANFSAAGAYVLVARRDGFPGDDLFQNQQQVYMFDQNLGVILPAGAQPLDLPLTGNKSLLQIASRLLLGLVWLAALAATGAFIVSRAAKNTGLAASPVARLVLGFSIGIGGFTLLLYLALWLGFALSRALILWLTLVWIAVGLGVYLLRKEKSSPSWSLSWLDWLYLGLLAGLSALVAFLAVGRGYHWSDEVVLWGAKGYGIASAGLSVGASEWGTRTTAYPLHLPLGIASFRVLLADILPQSKILFPIYYFSLLALVYSFLSRCLRFAVSSNHMEAVRHMAGGSALLLGLAPLVLSQGALAYANLPLAFYLVAAFFCAVWALEAAPGKELGLWWLSGACFALAAWTRPEGLVLSLLSASLLVIVYLARDRRQSLSTQSRNMPSDPVILSRSPASSEGPAKDLNSSVIKQRLARLIALLTPLFLYTLFWSLTAPRVYPSTGWVGQVFQGGLVQAAGGNLNPDAGEFVIRSFLASWFDPHTWGMLGFGILLLAVAALFFKTRRPASTVLVAAGLLCLAAIMGMYLLIANDPASNISWWVDTGLNRMLVPGVILLWVGLVDWAISAVIIQPSPAPSPECPE